MNPLDEARRRFGPTPSNPARPPVVTPQAAQQLRQRFGLTYITTTDDAQALAGLAAATLDDLASRGITPTQGA